MRTIPRYIFVLLILALLAFIAPLLAPYDPYQTVDTPYQTISLKHLAGTDGLGRDIMSQILVGSRTTLLVAVSSSLLSIVIGLLMGLIAATRNIIARFISSLIDSFIAIPPLVIMIFIASVLGPYLYSEIISIAVAYWSQVAKTFRAEVLSLLERGYIEASIALGGRITWIFRKHVIPNMSHLILANYTYLIGTSIVSEAVISFLGLSDQRYFSWGIVFYYAFIQGAVYYGLWQWILIPALVITAVVYTVFKVSEEILTRQ